MSVNQLDNERLYKVGYPTSNENSRCNGYCRKALTSETLQIGKFVYRPAQYDGKYVEWQHLNCFLKTLSFTDVIRRDPYFIQGFGSLR